MLLGVFESGLERLLIFPSALLFVLLHFLFCAEDAVYIGTHGLEFFVIILEIMVSIVLGVLLNRKWFVMFLYCCSAWIFYLLGSVLFATAVLSFLMKQSQGMEALQMLIGGFVIFMIPQVVGSVAVFLELVAATIRQVWYI